MIERVDLYADIHKAQRLSLFKLVASAGAMSPGDSVAVADLLDRIRSMVEQLYRHAEAEERLVHPLLISCAPNLVVKLHDAHVAIDGYLTDLLRRCEDEQLGRSSELLQEFYRALARFTAGYLFHVSHEEDEGSPASQAAYSNEELVELLEEFRRAHVLDLPHRVVEAA